MANTYGGVIFVGVGEDKSTRPARPALPPVGVDSDVRERLVNQCYTRLQPPFAPDVIPVTVSGGAEVLVVRIDTDRAQRPIVLSLKDSHKVWIRLEARNAGADRYRLAALFDEEPPRTRGPWPMRAWDVPNHAYPLEDRARMALVVRVAVEAPIPSDRLDSVMVDPEIRRTLDASLSEDLPCLHWIYAQLQALNTPCYGAWASVPEAYASRSQLTSRRWRAHISEGGENLDAPFGIQCSLGLTYDEQQMPSRGSAALIVDMTFDPDPLLAAIGAGRAPGRVRVGFRERLDLGALHSMVTAALETALDALAPILFPALLHVPVSIRHGPVVHLYTPNNPTGGPSLGLAHFIDVDGYADQFVPVAEVATTGPLYVPRGMGFETTDQRSEVVKKWITRLLLDMGLDRFDEDLASV
jgi:hypothetical protein